MPIRFPTEAANDPDVGAERTPRGHADGRRDPREYRRGGAMQGDPKVIKDSGKDINQPGFIRERDPKDER